MALSQSAEKASFPFLRLLAPSAGGQDWLVGLGCVCVFAEADWIFARPQATPRGSRLETESSGEQSRVVQTQSLGAAPRRPWLLLERISLCLRNLC